MSKDLSKRIADLSPAKLELLGRKLKEKRPDEPRNAIPRRADVASPALLSFAQQRLWFIDQLEPGSPFYNISLPVRLKGRLNVEALKQSFDELVRRHETLRTSFAVSGGEPVQVIAPHAGFHMEVEDLSGLGEAGREERARRLAEQEAATPFDLSRGPLLRARLLRLSDSEHVLLLTMHHIISDGWSMGVLVREVAALYEAYRRGEESPLEELPIQYADFAVWQRGWLRGEVLEEQLRYWREQLAGAPAVLELPTDRPRPPVQSFKGASEFFTVEPEVYGALKEMCQRERVTLFMALLAAFQTLLYRYTRNGDIVIGTQVANRNREETERLIGFFVNTLVMRTDLSDNPSFSELLGRVREAALGAFAHQDVPFEKLVEEMQPERSLSYNPLVQVVFMLQNAPREVLSLPDVELSAVPAGGGTTKFDLSLAMEETPDGLAGSLDYNSDLFDARTISGLLKHFRQLLRAAAQDPEQRLAALPLLDADERHRLIVEWNRTHNDYPRRESTPRLFEHQAAHWPDAPAVVFKQQRLSYDELNRRANQLAHYLMGKGVGPESLVGVYLNRSADMVVALLAILKAGAAYVPIDPAYPHERISFMVEDSGVSVLITEASLADTLPSGRAELLRIDADWGLVSAESEQNPEVAIDPATLAYVIYTSGSTGLPKGVAVSHQSLVNLLTDRKSVV